MDVDIIKKIARDAIRVDRVAYARSRVLTVAHDIDRNYIYNGKHYSPLVDTIEDDLKRRGLECQSVARIISRIKGPVSYANVVSPEGGFARALIRKRAFGLLRRGRYPFSRSEERVWGEVLDRTGAEKVVAILPSRELCAACHRRGIWVADVQHGVIAESHAWYGKKWRAADPPEWVPSAFLCWDRGSADVIDSWAADKGARTIVHGNRWVARFLKRDPQDSLVEQVASAFQQEIRALAGKPTILITLSWSVYNIPNGFMVDALADIIRKTADRYNWLIRLHPNHLHGFATEEGRRFMAFYDEKLRDYACSDWVTRAPLPFVLSVTDLHISWQSSAAIEAAQMGIKSALLDPDLRAAASLGDYYSYYRDKGMIDMVGEDEPSITAWIEASLGSRTMPESFEDYDREYDRLLDHLVNRPGQ